MADLVERLRAPAAWQWLWVRDHYSTWVYSTLPTDAADRIESDAAELATLRAERDKLVDAAFHPA